MRMVRKVKTEHLLVALVLVVMLILLLTEVGLVVLYISKKLIS